MQDQINTVAGIELIDNSLPQILRQERMAALRIDAVFTWLGRNMRSLCSQSSVHPDALKQRKAAADALFTELAAGNAVLTQPGTTFVSHGQWVNNITDDAAVRTAALDDVFSNVCDSNTRQ